MDLFTGNLHRLISLNARVQKAYTTEQIPPPRRPADPGLPTGGLALRPELEVPLVDDDEPSIPAPIRLYLAATRRFTPHRDGVTPWGSVDEARTAIAGLGPLFTAPEVDWGDPDTDEALFRFVTHGLAAHRLERVDGQFVVRNEWLGAHEVRPGLLPYGGDAWFAADGRPLRIRLRGQEVHPGDADWAAARFAFRSSVLVGGTLADHFARSHYHLPNAFARATARHLPPDHALRRFLKPFLFRTAAANAFARELLYPEWGFLHRVLGFTWDGLKAANDAAFEELRVERFDVELRRHGVHPDDLHGIDYAYGVEALGYWRILEAFVAEAFAGPALGTAAVDDAAQRFLADLGPAIVGERAGVDGLAELVTIFLFTITAFHAQAQNAQAYLADPRFCSPRLVAGQVLADRVSHLAVCTLISAVGLPSPGVDGDVSAHMPDPASREAAVRLRAALHANGEAMNARNAARRYPYRLLEPSRVSLSITV